MLRGISVGCGFFGNIHLEGWRCVQNAGIVAVVDRDEEKATETASRFGLTAYVDLVQAIGETSADFVDVATRPDSHLEIVETAAARGCHVLCQKPMAPTWDESVQIVKTCKRHAVRLMINENWRWRPWYRAVRNLIDVGVIGQVTTITVFRHEADALASPPFPHQPYFAEMERFLLVESVIHLVDVARFLSGSIEEVTCDTRRLSGASEGEDNVHLHLRLDGGDPLCHGRPADTPRARGHVPGPFGQAPFDPATDQARPVSRLLHADPPGFSTITRRLET